MRQTFVFLTNTLLPILFIALAVVASRQMLASKPPPPRVEQERTATLVEVARAAVVREHPRVRAQGTVTASRQTTLQSEVVGRITELTPRLVLGGYVSEGETLVRVDPRDYRIALAETRANLESARTNVSLEDGRRRVAEREWELFREHLDADTDASLALREPQLRATELSVEAAEIQVDRARVNLSRTTIRAPFDAIVLSEQVEEGQLLTQQSTLATLAATDAFWVEVALPLDDLPRVRIAGFNDPQGDRVEIVQEYGGRRSVREGRAIRLLPDVDTSARMARVLVEVEDPLLLRAPVEARSPDMLPLLLGSLVDCEFIGADPVELVEIPRRALRTGHTVWVMTDDDTLETRAVTLAWSTPDTALLRDGLAAGERYVTSALVAPVDGMHLRTAEAAPAEGAAETPAATAPPTPAEVER